MNPLREKKDDMLIRQVPVELQATAAILGPVSGDPVFARASEFILP